MDVSLSVVEGPRAGIRFRAHGRSTITIGRSKTTDFHVLDGTMSRVHAVVARDSAGWYVEDQRSRNGLWLGEQRVEKIRLKDGMVFHLGRFTGVRFELVDEDRTAAEESLHITLFCARCGDPIAPPEIVRNSEGRPFHVACRDLEHLVGTELGGFKVTERMDPLGDAFFFRAHQPTLNRNVVIEVFDPPLTSRPGFREALLDEVRRASRYLHPSVLQIFDFVEARGMCFVVIECFEGQPLSKVLAARRFVKIREAVSVAEQAAQALQYAREQGAVLPWISPSAILVSESHEVKVKLFREPAVVPVTIHAADAAYVAPEILSGASKGQEASSIVYSVGAMLYHMLAGIPAFEGETTTEVARRAQHDTPPGLRKINLKVSPALAQAVETALDRRPEARPAGLPQLLDLLRHSNLPPR